MVCGEEGSAHFPTARSASISVVDSFCGRFEFRGVVLGVRLSRAGSIHIFLGWTLHHVLLRGSVG